MDLFNSCSDSNNATASAAEGWYFDTLCKRLFRCVSNLLRFDEIGSCDTRFSCKSTVEAIVDKCELFVIGIGSCWFIVAAGSGVPVRDPIGLMFVLDIGLVIDGW
ncbi:hypothetical protein WICPIJ_007508 [Wickerhamomyces pijperi]|uniref:Uncharacterized protein n=1 Tax=Wickerhamomyces pijperi TaxID=599730 RepID=A0A9P8PZM9_WICPI|nr:hypothetical protein WICPIJ_007508 [Wickerhamomyces pijperi]